jgi:hypothetical protein
MRTVRLARGGWVLTKSLTSSGKHARFATNLPS